MDLKPLHSFIEGQKSLRRCLCQSPAEVVGEEIQPPIGSLCQSWLGGRDFWRFSLLLETGSGEASRLEAAAVNHSRAGRTSRQALQSLSAAGASSAVPGTTDWKQAVTGLGQEDSLRPSQVSAGAGMPLPQPRGMLGGVVQSWLWFL